jgi:hypothetical protein
LVLVVTGVGAGLFVRRQQAKALTARRAAASVRTRNVANVYGVHESRSRKELEGAGVKVVVVTSGSSSGGSGGSGGGGGGGGGSGSSFFGRRAAEAYVDPYDAATRAAEEAAGRDDVEPERPDPLAGLARPKLVRGASSLTAKASDVAAARSSRSLTAKASDVRSSSSSSSRGGASPKAEAAPARRSLTDKAAPARPARR